MELMGIINLAEADDYLGDLTRTRPLGAVPFGGRYRLIDFALSNMVNSGVSNVGLFIQHKYRSLMDHLRSGKEWDLARKRDGLFILPPAYSRYPMQMHRGDVENFYSNIDYISNSRQKYVVVSGVNMVTNMDYRAALEFHKKKGADITVIYTEADCIRQDCSQSNIVEVEEDGRISDIKEYSGRRANQMMSMEMFIMEKELLVDLINECISQGDYDFVKHCIIKNRDRVKLFGYFHPGYVGRIVSLQSYYNHNMKLLEPKIWRELFFKSGLIYTKVKDEPPSKYMPGAQTFNSLVAGGCHVAGTVEGSILFRGVKVHKGAQVKNCIIMQKGEIEAGVVLENVICDKDVRVTMGKHLKGEFSYPLVIRKGRVI
jgi:glucose-1-phosphate adenylyltransferase